MPSARLIRAANPSRSFATRTSARRRGTGLTLRSGPYSGLRFEPITASSAAARSFRLVSRPQATRAEIAGALLHDVGKIECGLGTWGRVAASVLGRRGRRFSLYHDHERIGSDLAAAAGSEPETVDLIAERGPAYEALHACDRA